MEKDLKEYRKYLIQTVQKLNENYDKLIITLSGGALALSLVFLKDVIKKNQIQEPILLIMAWGLFIASLASILGALLFGIAANKKAIKQVDANTIYKEKPGGLFSKATTILHYASSAFLIIGLISIAIFASLNMEVKDGKRQNITQTTTKRTTQTSKEGEWQKKLGATTSSTTPAKTKEKK
jgi:hypothetical protein